MIRLAVLAALLGGCLPAMRPSSVSGVTFSDSRAGQHEPCSRAYDVEAARVAGAVLAEVRRRKLLVAEPMPLQLCIVDQAPPIHPAGTPVYGMANPLRDRVLVWVAGQHAAWRRTLAHEVLAALAYTGKLRGWPREERDVITRADYAAIRDAAARATP